MFIYLFLPEVLMIPQAIQTISGDVTDGSLERLELLGLGPSSGKGPADYYYYYTTNKLMYRLIKMAVSIINRHSVLG